MNISKGHEIEYFKINLDLCVHSTKYRLIPFPPSHMLMLSKMKKGVRYRICHPAFSDVYMLDDKIHPDSAGIVNSSYVRGCRTHEVLLFKALGIREVVIRGRIEGLFLVLRDEERFEIYEEGQENPSGKRVRELRMKQLEAARDSLACRVMEIINSGISSDLQPGAQKEIFDSIRDFEKNLEAQRAKDFLRGICSGFRHAGVLPGERVDELLRLLAELSRNAAELAQIRGFQAF